MPCFTIPLPSPCVLRTDHRNFFLLHLLSPLRVVLSNRPNPPPLEGRPRFGSHSNLTRITLLSSVSKSRFHREFPLCRDPHFFLNRAPVSLSYSEHIPPRRLVAAPPTAILVFFRNASSAAISLPPPIPPNTLLPVSDLFGFSLMAAELGLRPCSAPFFLRGSSSFFGDMFVLKITRTAVSLSPQNFSTHNRAAASSLFAIREYSSFFNDPGAVSNQMNFLSRSAVSCAFNSHFLILFFTDRVPVRPLVHHHLVGLVDSTLGQLSRIPLTVRLLFDPSVSRSFAFSLRGQFISAVSE